jgi:hypothetical protein
VYSLPSQGHPSDWNLARRLICQHAEFDWVLCLDADQELHADALEFLQHGPFLTDNQSDIWLWGVQVARGHEIPAPEHPGIFMRWDQLGAPVWQNALLRRHAVLAAGNWSPTLGEPGGYELIWRMVRLGYVQRSLPWTGSLVHTLNQDAHPWVRYRASACLIWDWLRRLDLEGLVRSHPWLFLQALGLVLLSRPEWFALFSWYAIQALHLWLEKPKGYARFWLELPSLMLGPLRKAPRLWTRHHRNQLFETFRSPSRSLRT